VSYRERDFTELIDEDKREFVCHRVVATVLGGFRIEQGVMLALAQVLVWLIVPAGIAVGYLTSPNDRVIGALGLGGGIPLAIGLMISVARCALSASQADEIETVGDAFKWLFPSKSGPAEWVWATVVTYAYGAGMTYALHPATLSLFWGEQDVPWEFADSAPFLVLAGLTSYSLFSAQCPELAIYRDNEDFASTSNHYGRPLF
jgi:hypothetical protein